MWDDTALIKAYDKAVASFKVRGGPGGPARRREGSRPFGRLARPAAALTPCCRRRQAEARRCASCGLFSFSFLKNALKNGDCSEPSDKKEQRAGVKRKNSKKNRNRNKSNAVPLKQVIFLVDSDDV